MNDPQKQSISDLIALIRKETRAATLFVQTVAESSDMHPTDIKCLDFLTEVQSATAGDLARVTGLTTGAITAVIDRMEKAGFVKRKADNKDRRKIIVEILVNPPQHLRLVHNLFSKQLPKILSEYTAEELQLITDWNVKMTNTLQAEIKNIQNKNS
jgi:DNA-binding MarR family transcriptional regulator